VQLNSSKPIAGLAAMFTFAYIIFILLASEPLTRIDRICTPLTVWPEKVVVSGVRVFSPSNVPAFESSFDTGFKTCRRWTWGILYRDEYERLMAAREAREAQAKGVAPAPGSTTKAKDGQSGEALP
jgi:hypothetical protein